MEYIVTAPDGKKYRVKAPEGATQEQVLSYARENYGKTKTSLRASNPAEYDPSSPEFQARYGPGEKTFDPFGQQIAGRLQAASGGLATGAAYLAGLPADTGQNLINLGLTGYGAAKNLVTGRKDSPPVMRGSLGTSENLMEGIRAIGGEPANLSPEDAVSRWLHRGATVAGASAGSPLRAAIPAAIGGAAAGETLGDEWTGIGAMTPATAGAGYRAARAGSQTRTAAGTKVFTDIGVQPSAGLATQSSFWNGLENLISKFPGGDRVMAKFRDRLQADIGKNVTTGVSAERAGNVIEQGIRREGGFLDRTKARWRVLDQAVSSKLAKLPGGAAVNPVNTTTALQKLTTPVVGAERSTGGLVNPKLRTMLDDINADLAANPQGLPYEALRVIRTKVGGMLDDALVSDVPTGELKQLYGALSDDMEMAARSVGAGREFVRQNRYYKARMDRIENVLNKVIGKGKMPEDIFRAIDPKDPYASSKLAATLRSLEPSERRVVSDAVINRLGKERPSGQSAAGDVFSSDVFLTNWNKISPKAKAVLFPDGAYRNNLDRVAKAAEALRRGQSSFENTSGAVGSFAAAGVYMAPFVSLVQLDATVAIAAAKVAGGAFLGSKLLTHPPFVAWLASGPKGPPQAVANHFARLGALYNGSDDEEFKAELEEYIKRAGQ